MIIVGIILLAVAAGCFFAARGQMGRARVMSATDTYTAQMLNDLYTRVAAAVGGDALAEQCEVEGVIECDAPLTAPLSGTMCVAYTHTVVREYEEQVTTTDQQGNKETRTQQGSETVENDSRQVPFWVRDATGRVLVSPEQAELDLVDTGDRYDAAAPTSGLPRTLGHRHHEQALPVSTRVYVLGCAVDGQGQPMIGRNPRDGKQKFIISRRSERELMSAAESAARNFTYAAAGLAALGVILIVIWLVR